MRRGIRNEKGFLEQPFRAASFDFKGAKMKKILLPFAALILLIPSVMSARIWGDIWAGAQLNYPALGAVSPPIARLQLNADLTTPVTNLLFKFRLNASYGTQFFGTTPVFAPVNNVIVSNYNFALDETYIYYADKHIQFYLGNLDLQDYEADGGGFFNFRFCGNEFDGFFSSHFLRMLANHGLDHIYYPTIPAMILRVDFNDNLTLRVGVTFGKAFEHLFVRNSFPVELNFHNEFLNLSLQAGFVDADSSLVHKVSPSVSGLAEIKPFYFASGTLEPLAVFVKYGIVYPDITTFRTPPTNFNDDYRVAKEFSPYREHFGFGLAFHTKDFGFGVAYSLLKTFNSPIPEQVFEFFFRTTMLGIFEISPDFQLLINPAGDDHYAYHWNVLPEFEYLFNPGTDTAPKYVYIVGLRITYKFDLGEYFIKADKKQGITEGTNL